MAHLFRVATAVSEGSGENIILTRSGKREGIMSSQGNTKFYLIVSEKSENFIFC